MKNGKWGGRRSKKNIRAGRNVIRTEVWLHGTKEMIARTDETSSTVEKLKGTAELAKEMCMIRV